MPTVRASGTAIAICTLLLLVGVTGTVVSWGAFIVDSGIQAYGPRALASVLKKEYLRDSGGDSDFVITYRFILPSGEAVVSERGVSKRTWSELKPGSIVTIAYSKNNPKRNFPEGGGVSSPSGPIFASAVFGAVGALGASFLYRLFRPQNAG